MDVETVKRLVSRLIDEVDMTPQEISEAMEGRVSARTIYRWGKGESVPGNSSDYEALCRLVSERCPDDPNDLSSQELPGA